MTVRNHRRLNSWAVLLLLTVACCATASAEKIRVHYDKTLDFTKFKTYGWAPHGAVARPMLALDFVGAVEDESGPDHRVLQCRRYGSEHDVSESLV